MERIAAFTKAGLFIIIVKASHLPKGGSSYGVVPPLSSGLR